MGLELTNFFLGTAVALFISILAWGNFIKEPREDLLKLEQKYVESLGEKRKKILPLIRPYSKYTFKEQMSAALEVWSNEKVQNTDIQLFKEIKELHNIRKKLEIQYSFRYFGTILLMIFCFIIGILSELSGEKSWIIIKGGIIITNNWFFIFIFLISILIMIINCLSIYFKENKFAKKLFEALDKTED